MKDENISSLGVPVLRINRKDLPGLRPNIMPSRYGKSGSSRRAVWAKTIRDNAQAIMEHVGNVAITASDALDAMAALDLKVFPIRKSNSIGDAMGSMGLNLPLIKGYGRKLYLLLPLVMTGDEWEVLASDMEALNQRIVEKNLELTAGAGGSLNEK